MRIKESIAILLLLFYSLFLGLSDFLHIAMFLPIFLEIYRNKSEIFIIFKKLILLNIFIAIIAFTVYFSNEKLAILIFIRSNLVVLLALLLFHNRNYFDIALGLKDAKMPNWIVNIFYFNAKFIYMFLHDIKNFKKNLLLRGFRPKINLFTYQTYANFIGLLFVHALYKANTLSNMLILRGFKDEIYSLKKPEKIGKYEIILFIFTIFSFIFSYTFSKGRIL